MMIFMQKKSHPKFNVPNFGAKHRKRVPERWRKQRGIDNKKREKRSYMGAEPNIGYGNPMELKGVRANGKRTMIVRNPAELQQMIKEKKLDGYDVIIAGAVARRKRIEMTKIAQVAKINVTNGVYK
jgi:large subunit ribosomal protein L32e